MNLKQQIQTYKNWCKIMALDERDAKNLISFFKKIDEWIIPFTLKTKGNLPKC